jgi:hypothetical protein
MRAFSVVPPTYRVRMPTPQHESPIALAKLDPGLVAWLLTNVFDMKVPDYHHARAQATDVRVLVPRTYHADGMLLFCDRDDHPLLAVVLEVQRGWDLNKRRTWKLYVAQLEAELNVDTALVVYCPDRGLAGRYRDLFVFDGLCLFLQPMIFTPDNVPLVVDVDMARANPALAVLSALCHGHDPDVDAAFPALLEAMHSLGPERAVRYHDVVLAGLPLVARSRWETFMTTVDEDYEYLSDTFRDLAAKHERLGEARGETKGEARALLTVLEGRGVAVPAEVRDRILACTELSQLDTWLRRAINATTIDDVIRE